MRRQLLICSPLHWRNVGYAFGLSVQKLQRLEEKYIEGCGGLTRSWTMMYGSQFQSMPGTLLLGLEQDLLSGVELIVVDPYTAATLPPSTSAPNRR